MSFFDEVVATVAAAGKKTVQSAKDVSEIGKLRLQIAREDQILKNEFAHFGLLCYASIKNDAERDLTQEINKIDERKNKVAELRTRLSQLRKEKKCPHCGSLSQPEDQYCRRCGRSFEE